MEITDSTIYRFEDFLFVTKSRQLYRLGWNAEYDNLSLTPKVGDLLLFFLERKGEILPKDEILEEVWKDTFVTASLQENIKKLRQILCDTEKPHSFIETVPKRGYVFIAEAEKIEPDNLSSENSQFYADSKTESIKEEKIVTDSLKNLVKFFGKAIKKQRIRFVIAYRQVDDISLMKGNLDPNEIADGVTEDKIAIQPELVKNWIPQEDLRASVAIMLALSEKLKLEGFDYANDNYDDFQKTNCTFSLGLFSTYTLKLSKKFPNLFQIKGGYSPKNPDFYTDNIAFDNKIIPDIIGKDIAIVARIVIPLDTPGNFRLIFIAAGRTAAGTAAAGYFIGAKWTALLKLYEDDPTKDLKKDSLAVIISHNEPKKSEDKNENMDGSGEIVFNENGEPLIKWARYGED